MTPVAAAEAIALIRPGSRVYVATGGGTPIALLDALAQSGTPDIELVYFLLDGTTLASMIARAPQIRHRPLYVGEPLPREMAAGVVSYLPLSLPQAGELIASGRLVFDAAIVATSLPDADGQVSFGTSVGLTKAVMLRVPLALAELVPAMPATTGDTLWPLAAFRALVRGDHALPEFRHARDDERSQRIGRYVSRLIEDGATLQCGPGRVPAGALRFLGGRRRLRILTDMLTEEMVDLVESKAVCGDDADDGPAVMASWCSGTEAMFSRMERNPRFSFWPIDVVTDATRIRARPRMVSITQALAIDVTGQACCDRQGEMLFGGLGSQPEFMRAAAEAPAGKPIICLYATDSAGESNVRVDLACGDAVTIPRANVHFVVTEFGIASLQGKSMEERVLAMVEIADPRYRSSLLEGAQARGLIPRAYSKCNGGAYRIEDERVVSTTTGAAVTLRPARLSDAPSLQRLFHRFGADDIYLRYFRYLRSLSIEEALRLCTSNHAIDAAFIAVTGEREAEHVIASACFFGEPTSGLAEVGYLVDPRWQGCGLGRHLQALLIDKARAMGLRGLSAQIVATNAPMRGLAACCGLELNVDNDGDTCDITMTW
ncbi:MAG: GNAT family N-acetyltransferase [Rudaea sp.]